MRNFYKVSAGGWYTVVNAASISAGTAKGLRTLARNNGFKDNERRGWLYIAVQIVKRNVRAGERPNIDDYKE